MAREPPEPRYSGRFCSAGDVTVIASPYGSREQVLGTVGVIGPTRMNYQRIIPLVNFTAHARSIALDKA